MDFLWYVLPLPVVVGLVVALVRAAQHRGDADRRQVERATYEERQREDRVAGADAAVMLLAERFFPFAVHALKARTPSDADTKTRLRGILSSTPGIELGRASIGYAAILPLAERRKHLAVLGKSGFGKTTISLRLIADDLNAGRGLGVLGWEAESFRDGILPLIPQHRAVDTICYRPADPECPLTWNPAVLEHGEDQPLAAGELCVNLKESVADGSIGPRADAMLGSSLAVLVGRAGATLWSVLRLLEDEAYRSAVLADVTDPYLLEFWTKTFPGYPANAVQPLANRLNQLLRLPQLRASICHPVSSFSIRDALANNKILLFDLSGLDADAAKVLGKMLLGRFQIELMRRERICEEKRDSFHLYVDEFHIFADSAEGTWRELLARGRRYGLGLHLFTQHPNQLPQGLQHEIFGNVSSLIALNLSAAAAATARREFLVPGANGLMKPVSLEDFVSLPVGEGFARLGSGAGALRVRFAPPIDRPNPELGDSIRKISWKIYAAPPQDGEMTPRLAASGKTDRDVDVDKSESVPGRGGRQHKMLQQLVKKWGEEVGLKAEVEAEVLGGAGRVDVALTAGERRIGCEIAISSKTQQVCASVNKYLAAEFGSVIVISTEEGARRRIEAALDAGVTAKDRGKVRVLSPEECRLFLAGQSDDEGAHKRPAGFRIKLKYEPTSVADSRERLRVFADLLAASTGRGPA